MTDEAKRLTLASLNTTLHEVTEQVEALTRQRQAEDHEASIAGRCAKALDSLRGRDSRESSNYSYGSVPMYGATGYNYQPLYQAPTGSVPRVLDYLRQRYDLPDPSVEAQRLSAELQRAYARIGDLEGRLQQISGAVSA